MWCHKEHPDTDPDPDPDPDTDSEKPDLLHAITNPGMLHLQFSMQ
jgi:hypothetical protein